jgi:hypothetical protein
MEDVPRRAAPKTTASLEQAIRNGTACAPLILIKHLRQADGFGIRKSWQSFSTFDLPLAREYASRTVKGGIFLLRKALAGWVWEGGRFPCISALLGRFAIPVLPGGSLYWDCGRGAGRRVGGLLLPRISTATSTSATFAVDLLAHLAWLYLWWRGARNGHACWHGDLATILATAADFFWAERPSSTWHSAGRPSQRGHSLFASNFFTPTTNF